MTKKASSKSASTGKKPATAQASRLRKAAPKPLRKTLARKVTKVSRKKSKPDIEELQTEDIWAHYQTARRGGPKQAVMVEKIRNVLMERHYPLVKYIAERLQVVS